MGAKKDKIIYKKVVETRLPEDVSDAFDHARIEITRALAQRIMELHTVLMGVKASFIHEFDYTPVFLLTDYDDKDKLKEAETGVECEQLVVADTSFWWEGLLKHCDYHWSTDSIPIEVIEALLIPADKLLEHVGREWTREEARETFNKRLAKEVRA